MLTKRLLKRPLVTEEIQGWAVASREATGESPTRDSGPIAVAKFETWRAVDDALCYGFRGLLGGSSLAQFLAEELGARNI